MRQTRRRAQRLRPALAPRDPFGAALVPRQRALAGAVPRGLATRSGRRSLGGNIIREKPGVLLVGLVLVVLVVLSFFGFWWFVGFGAFGDSWFIW